MKTVTVSDFQKNPLGLLLRAGVEHEAIRLDLAVKDKDVDVVIMSGSEYRKMQEALNCTSVPGMKDCE